MKKSLLSILLLFLVMLSENKEVLPKTFILKEEKTGNIIMGTHSESIDEEAKNKRNYYIPNIIIPIKNKRPEPRPTPRPSQK